ncbi:hypothetical protein CP556_24770 [Natrinema sp. CBA1119]|uniref:hypothetical protein n=1 Tax=Natrinema sp. CBA1119 TaxID=1608465 RepID=UPI000BFA7A8E|nr:hypothetical protein [Natrinema sp. CBA1119]PGF14223.1 hypothetical protein CP556_24770 [Natrinema sp. CBA1119]
MRECRLEDDTLLISALVEYHDVLRDCDTERARRAWIRARDLAAEHGLTIDEAVGQYLSR